MKLFEEKCRNFISSVSAPAKKERRDYIDKHVDNFVKFPGSLSVVSILFASSELVESESLALFGFSLVTISLLIALNISRSLSRSSIVEFENLNKIEFPMVLFSKTLTQFTRGEKNSSELKKSYKQLIDSYTESSSLIEQNNSSLDFVKNSINYSFCFLVAGIIACFLSTFEC